MPNFLDSNAETDQRLGEYSARLFRIEAHLRRGEKRAAGAQLDGFIDELARFADDMDFPLETMIVGSQLGFFTGGPLLRGRLPAALVGGLVGWFYGQQSLRLHRMHLEDLFARVGQCAMLLENDGAATPRAPEQPIADAQDPEREPA